MKAERARHLERYGGHLTRAELDVGWHFCREFDFLLTQGELLDEHGRCAFCGFDRLRERPRGAVELAHERLLSVLVARMMLRWYRAHQY